MLVINFLAEVIRLRFLLKNILGAVWICDLKFAVWQFFVLLSAPFGVLERGTRTAKRRTPGLRSYILT